MPSPGAASPIYLREIRLLLLTAMVIFVFTVVVGILNGTDTVDFNHKQLMAHVHSGTLGWITLSVIAAALWLFSNPDDGAAERRLVRALAIAAAGNIAAYVILFYLTANEARPAAGTAVLTVIVAVFSWVLLRARTRPLSVPHLGLLAAIGTSASGGLIGVLLGFELATGWDLLPSGAFDAHPATMVVGFLVPVGMALAEWRLDPESPGRPASRAGYWQIGLPFAGGLLLLAGTMWDITPLIGLSLPFEVVGVGIFLRRMAPRLRAIDWRGRPGDALPALSAAALVLNIGFLAFLIIRYEGDLDAAPERLILTLDHIMFIGVLTNALFGQLRMAAADAGRALWADAIVAGGMNAGLAGFAVGLIADEAAIKNAFTPLLGLSILVGLSAAVVRLDVRALFRPSPPPSPPVTAAAA